jgi:hypothetical protein
MATIASFISKRATHSMVSKVGCENIPVKTIFVPPQAIQGEDVPAYILWDSLNFPTVRIQMPDTVKIKALFNVDQGMFEISGSEVLIKKVAVDGYVGMLFATTKVKECFMNATVSFSLYQRDGEKIAEQKKTICLFRPQLEVIKLPDSILVTPERGQVRNKIRLRKAGQGTLIITFSTPEESEAQKGIPNGMNEFLTNVRKDLEINMSEVKKAFPEFASIIDQYVRYIIVGWTSYIELDNIRRLTTSLAIKANENEEFAYAFFEALAKSIVKNLKLFTLPESLLKYLDSVLPQKVWLLQPWQIIPVSKEPKKLILEILPTDLILDNYELVKLPPIQIQGTTDGSIEIAKLFEWR